MIPLVQHRRFSETVAVDYRQRPQEVQIQFDLPRPRPKTETSELMVVQPAAPQGVRMDVEISKAPVSRELSRIEYLKSKQVSILFIPLYFLLLILFIIKKFPRYN